MNNFKEWLSLSEEDKENLIDQFFDEESDKESAKNLLHDFEYFLRKNNER